MKKNIGLKNCLLIAALTSTIIGCAGTTSGVAQNVNGNWARSPQDQHNTTWNIAGGMVNGTSGNFTLGGTDTITGTVQGNGSFFGTIKNDQGAMTQYSVSGTVKNETDANHIRVIYDGTVNGAPQHVDMLMSRVGII